MHSCQACINLLFIYRIEQMMLRLHTRVVRVGKKEKRERHVLMHAEGVFARALKQNRRSAIVTAMHETDKYCQL